MVSLEDPSFQLLGFFLNNEMIKSPFHKKQYQTKRSVGAWDISRDRALQGTENLFYERAVAHACNVSTQEAEAGGLGKVVSSLGYTVCSRIIWVTYLKTTQN